MAEKTKTSPNGEKSYSAKEVHALTGYTAQALYRFEKDGVISKRPIEQSRWTETQIEELKVRRSRARPGRKRSAVRKRPKQFRMAPAAIETLNEFREQGGRSYGSDDAVLEHCVMHAKACPQFVPGNPNLAWGPDGTPEEVDLSGV